MADDRKIILGPGSRYVNTRLLSIPIDLNDPAKGRATRFGTWEPVDFPVSPGDVYITWEPRFRGTLDKLADERYGDYSLWWVIAHVNGLRNALAGLEDGTPMRIPDIKTVRAVLSRRTS